MTDAAHDRPDPTTAPLSTVAREWTRIGVTGFGGPPAHIALFRRLMVDRRRWMDAHEFEDANAACGLLPGPASTQLAIFCAYRVGGPLGAVVGGLGFVLPAVVLVLALSVLFFGHAPPLWVRGAGAGAGAAVAAVAVHAGLALLKPSFERVRADRARRARWAVYLVAAGAAAALIGPYLVIVLLACGLDRARAAGPPFRHRRAALDAARGADAESRRGRRARSAVLDRVQGRRALLRRRLRDHPADAGRRGRHGTTG